MFNPGLVFGDFYGHGSSFLSEFIYNRINNFKRVKKIFNMDKKLS